MVTVREYSRFKGSLRQDWITLYQNSLAGVFLDDSIVGYVANSCIYALKAKGKTLFFEILDDEKLQMIIPCRVNGKMLTIMGSIEYFDKVEILYHKACQKASLLMYFRAALEYWKNHGYTSLLWHYLQTNSTFHGVLSELSSLGQICVQKNGYCTQGVRIATNADSFEKYFGQLGKHVRQNCRTAYNRIKSDGVAWNFDLSHSIGSANGKNLGVKSHFDLYINRLSGRYSSSSLPQHFFKRYFQYVTKTAKGRLGFVADLSMNGELGAFMQGYYDFHNRSVVIPRLAIQDKFSRYSPGIILVLETIRCLISDNQIDYLDLLQGTEEYKIALGGEIYELESFEIYW